MSALAELVAVTRGWEKWLGGTWIDPTGGFFGLTPVGWPLAGELLAEMRSYFVERSAEPAIELRLERGRWVLVLRKEVPDGYYDLIEMGDTHPDPPTAVALCFLRWRGVDEATISAALEATA